MAEVTGDGGTYLEHIWVNVPKRQVKIMDNEGYDEIVTWEFSEDGCLLYTSPSPRDS